MNNQQQDKPFTEMTFYVESGMVPEKINETIISLTSKFSELIKNQNPDQEHYIIGENGNFKEKVIENKVFHVKVSFNIFCHESQTERIAKLKEEISTNFDKID